MRALNTSSGSTACARGAMANAASVSAESATVLMTAPSYSDKGDNGAAGVPRTGDPGGSWRLVLGFHGNAQADQPCNHHRQVQLAEDGLEHREAARDRGRRRDVAVAEGRQRHEAEVDPVGQREALQRRAAGD